MKNIRIKTNPIEDSDKYIQIPLEQNFDILEVLSLSLTQKDVYRLHNSDYGVLTGRCYMNNGLGIPNVKVSVFIPISDEDKLDPNFLEMYPYERINDTNEENIRYNLLRDSNKDECHVAVGTFPNKNAILDNEKLEHLYTNYFKFTTTTNSAGDYMFYGIPTGQHIIFVDCDLSDIGPYSQKPYDMIEEGSNPNMFSSPNQFKAEDNLQSMPNIISSNSGTYIYPFWGDSENEIIGVSRLDFELNYTIKPKAFFIGSIFSDNEKDSVNKNCRPRKKLGQLCETVEKNGTIEMIRKTINGDIEKYDIDDGDLIDENGNWVYRIPMNLDYMITDESGNMVPTEDTSRGIPTRSRVRFRVGLNESGDVGRIRTTAKFLIPHNPENSSGLDYDFDENTKDESMADFYWNKIYTTKSFIPRLQVKCESGKRCIRKRTMTAVKDVDDCVGSKNPFPYNKFNGKMNPLFTVLCILMTIIIDLLGTLNGILSWFYGIKILGVRPFKKLRCIAITCDDTPYVPGCSGKATPSGYTNRQRQQGATKECFRILLAEYIKIYSFDFYNDWINGTLYAMLLKYKERSSGNSFCDIDKSRSNVVLVNTLFKDNNGNYIGLDQNQTVGLGSGFVKYYNDELYYVPYTNKTRKLFAVDIYNLGSAVENDWQLEPKIIHLLNNTTYIMPTSTIEEDESVTPYARDDNASKRGLLFDFDCDDFDMNEIQINNLIRISEIGVGIDEDREYNNTSRDEKINNEEIENKYIRDALIYLNSNGTVNPYQTITSNFDGEHHKNYRNVMGVLSVPNNNSLYFYFGSKSGNTALDKLNKEYFSKCIQTDFNPLNVISTITNINNGSDGKIVLEVDGGVSPYFFEWSDGYTTQNRTNLSEGQYKVIISDSAGNSRTKLFSITKPLPIEFDVYSYDVIDQTLNDGKIIINNINGGRQILVNGVNTYTYKVKITGSENKVIDNVSSSGITISSLKAGRYNITIEDYHTIKTVSETFFVSINNPNTIDFKLVPNDLECKNGDNGYFALEYINGNPPYEWYIERKVGSTYTPYISKYDSYGERVFNDEIVDLVEGPTFTDIESIDKIAGEYRITLTDSISKELVSRGGSSSTSTRAKGKTLTYKISEPSNEITLYSEILEVSNKQFGYQWTGAEEDLETAINNSSIILEYNVSDYDSNGNQIQKLVKEFYPAYKFIGLDGRSYIGGSFDTSYLSNKTAHMINNEGCKTKKLV